MSTTSWNSLLLSKGSIFSTTHCTAAMPTDSISATKMPASSSQRLRALSRKGVSRPAKVRDIALLMRLGACWPCGWSPSVSCGFISLSASQGVTVKAMASDSAMPRLELIGIGLMYGPISPLTKAIGSSAAMTVSVARMVGPPTSSTATGMMSLSARVGSSSW